MFDICARHVGSTAVIPAQQQTPQTCAPVASSLGSLPVHTATAAPAAPLVACQHAWLQLLGCVSFATIATCAVAIKWLLYPIVPTFYLSFSITGLFFVVGLMIKVGWWACKFG